MRKSLEIALGEYDDLKIKSYKSAVEALKKMGEDVDLIITDINMPQMDGLEFIKRLEGKFDVIIMTGNATLNKAIESVRLGVKDFLTKPFDAQTLYEAIKRVEILRRKLPAASLKAAQNGSNLQTDSTDFVASSPALEYALNLSKRVAKTDASVMLMGESGVGKELFAKFIHKNSPRKDGPFIAINMAAIPENLIESELFECFLPYKFKVEDRFVQRNKNMNSATDLTLFPVRFTVKFKPSSAIISVFKSKE